MKLVSATTTILLFFLGACAASDNRSIEDIVVDLNEYSPRELLIVIGSASPGHVFVLDQHKAWVNQRDIPFLIEALQSDMESMSVSLTRSSYMDDGRSTIATEAYFMLLGYKHGVYPPSLNSTRHHLESREELLDWLDSKN